MNENIKSEIDILKRRRDRLNRLRRACDKKLRDASYRLACSEYGAPGTDIVFNYSSSDILHGTIVRFEETIWSDLPICIVKTMLNGRPHETHLVNGKSITQKLD